MSHQLSSATPKTGSPPGSGPDTTGPPRAPYTERIAGWSARHRKTAVLGWLALTAAAFIGGQQLGTKDLPSYDAGQGRAIPAGQSAAVSQQRSVSSDRSAAVTVRDPAVRRQPAAARLCACTRT